MKDGGGGGEGDEAQSTARKGDAGAALGWRDGGGGDKGQNRPEAAVRHVIEAIKTARHELSSRPELEARRGADVSGAQAVLAASLCAE